MSMLEARRAATPLCGFLCLALALVLIAPQKAEGQVLYGSIVGEVKDATGAIIPGATVIITNKGTGLTRQSITDAAGRVNFTDLPTGDYALKVSQQGFKTFEQTEVTVSINSVTRVNVTLEVGSIDQVIQVSAEPARLQTETSEVAVGMIANDLQNLPVALGRNYQQVYRMLPGFAPPADSHSIPTNPSRSLQFQVNGTSDDQNNTRIDGVSATNVQLPHVTSYVPSLESIEEVNVVTSSMDAEQGLAGGASVSVQTRSGTNEIHGSAFEYHTDNHLKAWPQRYDDAALNTGNKPKLVYNEYGGTVGGPIKKDKLFFFASYESVRNHSNVNRTDTVPLPAMIKGDLQKSPTPIYDPFTGDLDTGVGRTQFYVAPGDPNYSLCDTAANPECLNIIPASRMDPIAKEILALFPTNNIDRERSNYFSSGAFAFDRHQVDTKIDYNVNSKLNLMGTFGVLHWATTVPTIFGDTAVGRPIGGSSNGGKGHGNIYRLTIMGTYSFTSTFLMDAHFGWAHQGTASEPPGLDKAVGSDVLGIPGTNGTRPIEQGWPEFDFEDFATVGVDNNFMPYYRNDPQYQYVVNFNWMKGKHNIRFGGDIYRQGLNHQQAEFLTGGYGAQGGFDFNQGITRRCEDFADGVCNEISEGSRYNTAASALLGLSDYLGRTLQVPEEYHLRAWLFSAYARDRWTVTPKLTMDYGLRWEYFPVPTRTDRGIEYYDPNTNKVSLCGYGSVPGDCGIEVSKLRFGPRFGLAYRITDKFVMRAGYGLTNDPYEGMEMLRANYPILVQVNVQSPDGLTPAGSLTTGIPTIPEPDLGNGVIDLPGDYAWQGLPKKIDRGYVQSWNLTLQRELPMGFTAQVGYVATRSVRHLAHVDINAGQVIGAGEAGRALYDKFGRTAATSIIMPVGTGHYDSLQAQLQRRFSAGLSLTVNYTWGKAISPIDATTGWLENPAFAYQKMNLAPPGFDRTHILGIINVWQLPFGKGRQYLNDKGALSYILGGWQVNNMVSVMTGTPFSVNADGTSLNLPGGNQYADQIKPEVTKLGGYGRGTPYYDPTAFGDVTEARFGNTHRNYLRGPGLFNWDFGLFREFSFTERLRMQFRMESFNFTNTPHACNPDGWATDNEEFMTITSTCALAREGIDERQFRFGLRLVF